MRASPQFIENKNLTAELGARLLGHFEFQYQKAVSHANENRPKYHVEEDRSETRKKFVTGGCEGASFQVGP